jgi:hypothetical protein
MSEQQMRAIEEYIRWAYAEFQLEGLPVDTLVERGVERYGPNGQFIRTFVVEAMRYFAQEVITGGKAAVVVMVPPEEHLPPRRYIPTAVEEADATEFMRMTPRKRERLIEMVRTDVKPWARWIEAHPSTGEPMRLVNMTKEQVLLVADARDRQGEYARRRAELCRRVAAKMGEEQIVRDVLTERDLERIEAEIVKEEEAVKAARGLRREDRRG